MAESTIRNEYGEPIYVSNPSPPGLEGLAEFTTPQQVADSYLRVMRDELALAGSRVHDDAFDGLEAAGAPEPVLEFTSEKDVAGTKVVVYKQTLSNIDVFEAQLGMQIDGSSLTLESVQSSAHGQITIENPSARSAASESRKVSNPALKKYLKFDLAEIGNGRVDRQVIYRYEPEDREQVSDPDGGGLGEPEPTIPRLPEPALEGLAKGKHYIADEVLFEAALPGGQNPVNWRMLVEPLSGTVLYLRALVASATGMVFDRDPQTQTGAAVSAASSNTTLNPFRSSISLAGLVTATPQELTGNFVRVTERQAPVAAPPTVPTPLGSFDFNVRSDDFAAVNAYHNCDRLFRTMSDLGFDVASYFNGTSFPVPVDHRALGDAVNAQAPGNATGNGLLELRFGRMIAGQPVGIATCNRVAWHEFGHALLWDHVNSPNFGFAHSAGDTLASVLNDPGTAALDRFDTFPWVQAGVNINRRHDRAIADGWAWFGPNWNTQYGGEQVLSTTLFRFYRSIGGDSSDITTQRLASRTTAFLVFKGIGLLVATTPVPEVFVGTLQTADRTTPDLQGIAGGALHKVIRWAFEKQGLFQPNAAPGRGNIVNAEGNPPDVDVYIDDGRNGQYQYQSNYYSCQDMWVRRSADGGLGHQEPIVNQTNFMYVRVKNRGLQTATDVHVDAYHALPGSGLTFPDDFAPMATPTLPAGGPIASGGDTIIGPFAFVPTAVGHECLLAIAHARGDSGNDTTITGSIPDHRLVPFDNNIGQRNVHPVYPSLRHLVKLLREHVIWVRNPYKRPVVVEVRLDLPIFLRKLGWELKLKSEGGQKFELGPRDKRQVVLSLEPGTEFKSALVRAAIAKGDIEIAMRSYLDGELSGGVSYLLSFDADQGVDKPPPPKKQQGKGGRSAAEPARVTAENLLKSVGDGSSLPPGKTIRTIRVEFDIEDE